MLVRETRKRLSQSSMFDKKLVSCFLILLLFKDFMINDVTSAEYVGRKLNQPHARACNSTETAAFDLYKMTCSQGIYDMHLNNMPNKIFTGKLFCSPSPKPAYYFWNDIKNKDNLYNVTVCKMKQFTRSRRIELFCKQVMLSDDFNCDDTYADEENDAQESINFPATWNNASTTHFFVSISPSTEAPSSSQSLVKAAATMEDNNHTLFWIVTGIIIATAIIIILIGVIVHLIVCVCRYKHKYQCEKLRKQSVYYAVDGGDGLCETTKRFCRQPKHTTTDGVDGKDKLLKNSLNGSQPPVNQNVYTNEHPMIDAEPVVDTDTK